MNWTPYEIKVILHHYSSMAPFESCAAPIYEPTVNKLLSMGVLIEAEDAFGATELGAALVKMWCDTPLPVRKFVDPRNIGEAA
ncbi:hypothetical protein D9M72_304000 [compost metagenome]